MVRLIAHSLIVKDGKFLLIKRSDTNSNGKEKRYASYWDFPGGMVDAFELPKVAAVREAFEEAGLEIALTDILYEASNFDQEVSAVFTTLIYEANCETLEIVLSDEHVDFKWIDIEAYDDFEEQYVPYIIPSIKKYLNKHRLSE